MNAPLRRRALTGWLFLIWAAVVLVVYGWQVVQNAAAMGLRLSW